MDRRNVAILVEAFNRLADSAVSVEQVVTDAETTGHAYLVTWLETAGAQQGIRATESNLLTLLFPCATDPSAVKRAIEAILGEFGKKLVGLGADSDLGEDMAAWKELSRDIAGHIGKNAPLDEFLQELQLRSKEPSPKPDTVTLMTIHGAKGREFDCVYVVGLAEDVMPSFQSRQKGDQSPEMEEERRNCFVAITRTKECLMLSRADNYRGWRKEPSRFLAEMGLVRVDEET
jgi:DNA helicase-2/ATP-dependent DNA helicase PcrA